SRPGAPPATAAPSRRTLPGTATATDVASRCPRSRRGRRPLPPRGSRAWRYLTGLDDLYDDRWWIDQADPAVPDDRVGAAQTSYQSSVRLDLVSRRRALDRQQPPADRGERQTPGSEAVERRDSPGGDDIRRRHVPHRAGAVLGPSPDNRHAVESQ